MESVTLLGPQLPEPNLRAALTAAGLAGPFASISAGWQEREGEIEELQRHVGAPVIDLQIYARSEAVFAADPELRDAHRARQAQLQEMQELYGLQLNHAKQAARELFERGANGLAPGPLLRVARRRAVAALRRLDRAHFAAIRRVHSQFDARFDPATRPALRAAVQALRHDLADARVVLIAGGHVAALLNRLRLLGAASWLRERAVVAWSAGAMALTECVVLFHDRPPQGAANAEVFDAGLGLVRGIVALPHAQNRLDLHDSARMALFARRFAPGVCITLDPGACLHFEVGGDPAATWPRLALHAATFQLGRDGALGQLPPPAGVA